MIVGNIAPDGGVPNEDWSVFTPDTNISHFKTDGEIDIPKFLNKYMTGEKWAAYGEKAKSFFLGYYVHLLTDELWRDEVVYPTIEKHRELYNRDRMEAIWTFKKDWYALDHLFIRNHPDFQPFLEYENAVGFQNCLWRSSPGMLLTDAEFILQVFTESLTKTWIGNISICVKGICRFLRQRCAVS